MNYGLYLSANGAAVQSRRLDVIANNLANAGTAGFKQDLAAFRANHPYDGEHGIPSSGPHRLANHTGGPSLSGVVTNYGNGPIERTNNPFDIAVNGPGFLRVDTPKGEFLTRDGRLTVSTSGELVTRTAGHRVLDPAGNPIRISPDAANVLIGDTGHVTEMFSDGSTSQSGRIGLFTPESTAALRKLGHGLFDDPNRTNPAGENVRVQQGYLEGSGTNSVTEMLAMIEASRGFETNLNMIKHQDESLGRLLQAVPRR